MGRRARTLGVCNISGIIAIHNNWKAVRLIYRHHSAFSTKKRRWSKIRKKTTSLHKRSRNSWVSSKKRFEVRLRRTYSRKHQTMKRTKVLKIPPKKVEHLARSKGTLSTHEMPSTAHNALPTTAHNCPQGHKQRYEIMNCLQHRHRMGYQIRTFEPSFRRGQNSHVWAFYQCAGRKKTGQNYPERRWPEEARKQQLAT